MLKDFAKAVPPEKDQLKAERAAERERLAGWQMKIKEAKLPVMVVFEGWGSSGKGTLIGRIIKNIDPRFFYVRTMKAPTSEEKRFPFLYRYVKEIPEAGQFAFFDTFWMEEITDRLVAGKLDDEEYRKRMRSITTTERSLTDNGYLVVKFFCHIDKKTQSKRLKALLADKNTRWRVNDDDLYENEHYGRFLDTYDRYLEDTSNPSAPWYIIDSENQKWAELQVLQFLNQAIDTALKNSALARPILQNVFPLEPTPKLADISLEDKVMASDEAYKSELERLQAELRDLHYEIYRRKIPVVIAYEGWDAAGKGGNIKRVAQALDARAYTIYPSPAPTKPELMHPHLWRYWIRLPKAGHVGIYDRSWYGRVLVERVEGFASTEQWSRAYEEINSFERDLIQWGAILLKFWVDITPEEQLRRFEARQNDPSKSWKITDEDWRNRDKYPQYKQAVDDMFRLTSTTYAPWTVLESDDKHYARIQALKAINEALEARLHK